VLFFPNDVLAPLGAGESRQPLHRALNHFHADSTAAEAGLRGRDLKGVNLDTGSAQAALVSKGVDATFGGYEYFKLRDQGLAKIIYSTQGQDPKLTRQAHLQRARRSSPSTRRRCSALSTSSSGQRPGPRWGCRRWSIAPSAPVSTPSSRSPCSHGSR
jgi:hypothetical protein